MRTPMHETLTEDLPKAEGAGYSGPSARVKADTGAAWLWAAGLGMALGLGAVLRLAWVADMEYKGDEAWTFYQSQHMGVTLPFRWLGMTSSVSIPNPGMSVWVFAGLARAFGLDDPAGLARAVQVLSILAVVLLVGFALAFVPRGEREPWLWAAALGSVNPLAVLFQRKIWPPSVFPLFTLALLVGWWHRDRRWGAFLWGLVGAVLGQIHMSGFFFAAAFAAWAWLFDRRKAAWRAWWGGSCVGALPLLPWAACLLQPRHEHSSHFGNWRHVFECQVWIRWLTEPFGLGLQYSLDHDFPDFLRYPLVGSRPTYLVAMLHLVLLGLALVILARAGRRLWSDRPRWWALWTGRDSTTAATQNAALWGFGLLLTLSTLSIPRHYLMVTFPLMFLWLARQTLLPSPVSGRPCRPGRMLLVLLCVAQFLMTASFLGYIHANQRPIQGDYGTPYGAQRTAPLLYPD